MRPSDPVVVASGNRGSGTSPVTLRAHLFRARIVAEAAWREAPSLTRPGTLPSGASRLVILADDMTGACDALVPFASRSRHAPVQLSPSPATGRRHFASAVDMNVRDNAADARSVAARVAASTRGPGVRPILKIDSTARGPIRALVDGALAGTGSRAALISPAHPGQGVIVVDHCVTLVNSLEGGAIDLAAVVGGPGRSASALHHIPLEVVERGVGAIMEEVELAVARGATRLIVDADTEECLTSTAAAWLSLNDILLVGAGGITARIADLTFPSAVETSGGNFDAPHLVPPGIVLIVAGSPSSVSRGQVAYLISERATTVVPRERGTDADPAVSGSTSAVVFQVPLALHGRDGGEQSRAIAVEAVRWARQGPRPAAVILAGGATARAFVDEAHVASLGLCGEVAPGIPEGVLIGGDLDGLRFATKAGRFGRVDALARAMDYFVRGQLK